MATGNAGSARSVRRQRASGPAGPAAIGTGAAERQNRDSVELGDYERASLRLELLTAGLDSEDASRERLAKVVLIASAGLAIDGPTQALLERVATALACTRRDPLAVLTGLVRRLDAEDGEVLLREYTALHTDRDEVHLLMADHWSALCQTSRSGAAR